MSFLLEYEVEGFLSVGDLPHRSSCGLHQIRMRNCDRINGRCRLNPASVYLAIVAGWKVNTERGQQMHTSVMET